MNKELCGDIAEYIVKNTTWADYGTEEQIARYILGRKDMFVIRCACGPEDITPEVAKKAAELSIFLKDKKFEKVTLSDKPLNESASWDSISTDAVSLINNLKKQIIAATEGSIAEIDYLKSALQLYKQAVVQSIDLNMDAADIISKYANSQSQSGMNNSYQLPGVFDSSVAGTINIDQMKKDNQMLLQTNDSRLAAEKQRDTSFKMIVQNYNDLKQRLNVLAQTNQAIFTYIAQINEKVNN